MAKKGSKASEDRRDYWRAAMELQKSSGQSIREFCATEGLAESAFYFWRRELASPKTPSQMKQEPAAAPTFVPVDILATHSTPVVIELPSGTRLNIGQGCSPELLRTVLELLPC